MTLEELSLFAEEYGRDIYGFCYYLSGDKHIAEELYQDTFLRATEKHTKIKSNMDTKSYIIGIAIRLWKNDLRKNANRKRIAPMVETKDDYHNLIDSLTPLDSVIDVESKALVLAAVDTLQPNHRLPIIMFYYWDMSIKDIAKILLLPSGTVKSRLHKGRERIKIYLEAHNYEK